MKYFFRLFQKKKGITKILLGFSISFSFGPHKIKNEIYEILRSSNNKSYDDLVKIIDCNDKEDILFLDDNFFTDIV